MNDEREEPRAPVADAEFLLPAGSTAPEAPPIATATANASDAPSVAPLPPSSSLPGPSHTTTAPVNDDAPVPAPIPAASVAAYAEPQPRPQPQPQQLHPSFTLRGSIQIPEFWDVERNNWPSGAVVLASLPPQRSIQKLGAAFRAEPTEWNMTAAVGQCVGDPAAEPCSKCRGGKGRFSGGCIVVPPGIDGLKQSWCCFNCRYQWQYKKCSLPKGEEQ
ncbi:hypothetical protein F5Y10DRAFT_269720 [Nemania abortiva]|nr:hypothetical protein F5Y10DRAFT_269720 [Nemania abortiva]